MEQTQSLRIPRLNKNGTPVHSLAICPGLESLSEEDNSNKLLYCCHQGSKHCHYYLAFEEFERSEELEDIKGTGLCTFLAEKEQKFCPECT